MLGRRSPPTMHFRREEIIYIHGISMGKGEGEGEGGSILLGSTGGHAFPSRSCDDSAVSTCSREHTAPVRWT